MSLGRCEARSLGTFLKETKQKKVLYRHMQRRGNNGICHVRTVGLHCIFFLEEAVAVPFHQMWRCRIFLNLAKLQLSKRLVLI